MRIIAEKHITLFIIIASILFMISCKKEVENKKEEPVVLEQDSSPKMIFFGDSLTAGMGLYSPEEAFPNLISKKLDAEGFKYKLINAGLSGDTTSGGLARLDWVLSKGVEVFILELGANDSMRGIPVELIEKNLLTIIEKVQNKNPKAKILLVPMKAFPSLGPVYVKKFEAIYPKIAKEKKITLTPFILEKVAGIKDLNQADGIHPTAKGHRIMADTIYPVLKEVLNKK